jgi:hypothetical protein
MQQSKYPWVLQIVYIEVVYFQSVTEAEGGSVRTGVHGDAGNSADWLGNEYRGGTKIAGFRRFNAGSSLVRRIDKGSVNGLTAHGF